MILFFYGTELLRPAEKIRDLQKRFLVKNPAGAGMSRFDCAENNDIKQVLSLLTSTSLFTQRRLVIIKNPFALTASLQRELAKNIEHIVQEDVVIFWEQGTVRSNAVLYKKLHANADIAKEYRAPQGQEYLAWIARRVDIIAQGTTITRDAAQALIKIIGDDLVRMDATLYQCVAYSAGTRITEECVQKIAVRRIESDVFRAVESLMKNNRKEAIILLARQKEAGEDLFKLFGLYAYQVRTLLAVRSLVESGIIDRKEIAQKSSLAPFVVSKAVQLIRSIEMDQLIVAHQRLTQLDHRVKSGDISMEEALYEFVARI